MPELEVDRSVLARMFLDAFNSPGYQPPLLPSTAIELMQIARRPDVTFPVVAGILEKEPMLASQVLRLAQSPIYRRAEPIRSLEQAASRLGLRTLADLFVQASVTAKVFRAPAYEGAMNKLRDHAVATAIVARLVCRETSHADEYAFLCGLLHDVGAAACIIVLGEKYGGGSKKGEPASPVVPVKAFWPVIAEIHEATAMKLADLWQLPADVRLVIGHHHTLVVGGMVHPLAAVICIAEAIATDLGHFLEPEVDPKQRLRAEEALRLSPAQLDGIRKKAKDLLSAG
jgi:HD-like signal output (HDOD) protein